MIAYIYLKCWWVPICEISNLSMHFTYPILPSIINLKRCKVYVLESIDYYI